MRLWLALPCALAIGCSADDGAIGPSGTGFEGGVAAQPDAGTSAFDSGGSDAHSPHDGGAPSNDASDASDGGRDLSTDPSKFFGNSRCAQSGLQLCDGFEGAALDTATWTVSGTKPVVDVAQHARGAKALHITQNGNGLSYIKESKTFPAPNNTYYGRMFVYFETLPAAPGMTYAHWTFAAASGTGVSGEIRLSGQLQNGNNLFGVGTDNRTDANGTGDWTNSDKDPNGKPSAVPLKKWMCIEWMHKGDTNETRFYWDGVEHPSLYTSATVHGGNANPYVLPKFTNVWVGWQEYQASTEAFDLWIDEVAIDPQRIGCVL